MKNLVKKYYPLVLVVALILVFDQLTKAWVENTLELGAVFTPWPDALPFVRIVHWYNTGVAFGLFQGMGQIFTILAIIVSIAIVYYFPRVPSEDWTLKLAMMLQMGGALGNLIDRVRVGHVIDFVWIGSFPVFNVADSCISIGVAVLLLGIWLQERRVKPSLTQPEAPGSAEGNG